MLDLIDYEDKRTSFDIDISKIKYMTILIISGDEVADIRFDDGTEAEFDSCTTFRIQGYFDGMYSVDKNELSKFIEIGKDLSVGSYKRQRLFERWKRKNS